jgi:hypothetical protein
MNKTLFHTLDFNRSPIAFAFFEAKPSAPNSGFYAGVLVIQKGPAKGHYAVKDASGRVVNYDPTDPDHAELRKYPIVIGDETLDDVVRCGAADDTTKCKLDHGKSIKDIVGDYSTFRRDGDQVRANLTLMQSSEYRAFVEELFAKFSKKVGNSIDFNFKYEIQQDVAVARCVKLNSVDIVDAPAATNSLFNENPTPAPFKMTKEELEQLTGVINTAVNTAVDTKFTALQTGIDTRLGKIEKTVTKLEEGEEDPDKKKKDKEEADGKEEMSALVKTATLSAVREFFPKTAVDNLAALSQTPPAGAGETNYDKKHQSLVEGGMTTGQATKFMSQKHPALYNAKFGNGGGQKQTKTTV